MRMDSSQRNNHHHPRNPYSHSDLSRNYRRDSAKYIDNNPTPLLRDATTRPSSSRRTTSGDSAEARDERSSRFSSLIRVPFQQNDDDDDEEGGGEASTSIIGTCPFMCPERERVQRERLRDLAVFERLNGDPARTSSSLAVKKFCRTMSTKDIKASDIRPLPVLDNTLKYLLELFDSSDRDRPFETIHDFIFDRTRSIRQDLSMQNIIDNQAIWMYEKMVKFHVISHYKLRECSAESPSTCVMRHLNMEQLTKSLVSLYSLYDINRKSDYIAENEAEFRSLYVLLHLGSHGHIHTMSESLSLWLRRLPSSLVRSKEMSFARTVLRFFRIGNFWRFFCTISNDATYLQLCIIETYVNEVRAEALACINYCGYKLHPYPLGLLSEILKMKESDLEALCSACGLETALDDKGRKLLPLKQTSFSHPKGGFNSCAFSGFEQLKRDMKIEQPE
ncbi:hypothetical protein Dimus_021870 [Dionaea muscipula]